MPDAIPLMRTGLMESIILEARDMGIFTPPYEKEAGLPPLPWGEQPPGIAMPLAMGMDFLEIVARKEGLPLFGYQVVNQNSLPLIRSFHLQCRACANVGELIRQFITQAQEQTSIADYRLIQTREAATLAHCGHSPRKHCLQTDLYTVAILIQLLQRVLGSQWMPGQIHLRSEKIKAIERASVFRGVDIRFNQPYRAIVFSRELLQAGIPSFQDHPAPGTDKRPELPREGISRQLEALLPAYLATGMLNSKMLEKISGMSFRTLQRRLQQEGHQYSEILLKVRLQQARELLHRTDHNLASIAGKLGYSNTPNFIRAFRHWTGISPGEYRRLYKAGTKASNTTTPLSS
ncbi:AraC family transcriptional regulator [Thiolapillus brandeum]|uniref:AraC family transcriptional regulator n=1 Tax=Thiolapillus brandeum TaxID=1076588 RepID=A0A7U6GK54_9GAMM|nr:AraC family transcriptional regulator [Thiolapillus brandeum]BAO45079.1 AraC family transcriptional regulator [Thiolapillus brandeum]